MPRPARAAGPASTRTPGSPFLVSIALNEDGVQRGRYPFTLPLFQRRFSLSLATPVTFLVGENGSGKSTLLEALAWASGFNAQGGERDNSYAEEGDGAALGRALTLAWRQRVHGGFFLRAETFFNFATWLEDAGSSFRAWGGKSFHQQSHGEAFLALFEHGIEDGLYLLDEPEAALSPARQLAFLALLHRLAASRSAQLVIATHSPILITLPGGDGAGRGGRPNRRDRLARDRALPADARLPGRAGALAPALVRRGRLTLEPAVVRW